MLFNHLRGIIPLNAFFDEGTEPTTMKELIVANGGIVHEGPSKNNIPIEAQWELTQEKILWTFRMEGFFLQQLFLFDSANPLHISIYWWSYAHIVQYDLDEGLSVANHHYMVDSDLF